jgi:hypothetical protein
MPAAAAATESQLRAAEAVVALLYTMAMVATVATPERIQAVPVIQEVLEAQEQEMAEKLPMKMVFLMQLRVHSLVAAEAEEVQQTLLLRS